MTPELTAALSYFVRMGWTPEQAAGILANLVAESGLNPAAIGDGGAAYGVAQWHGDRQAHFAAIIGKDIHGSSVEEQLAFVHAELNGFEKAAGDALRLCTTARDAGASVSMHYERPADKEAEAARRGAAAESLLQQYGAQSEGAPMAEPQAGPDTSAILNGVAGIAASFIPGGSVALPLVQQLLKAFQPLAQQKLTDALAKHTDQAGAIATGVLNAVAQATDQTVAQLQADPKAAVTAVATVQADPQKLAQVEAASMAHLEALQPLLNDLRAVDAADNAARIAGADAASRRAAVDKWDMTPPLVWGAFALMAAIVVGLLGGMGWTIQQEKMEWFVALLGLAGPILTLIAKAFSELYAYRFDSTPNSTAKDAVIAELAKK